MLKILWFEISVPSKYKSGNAPVAGWQDSLEYIVRQCPNIELTVSFIGNIGDTEKEVGGVKYVPLVPNYNRWNKIYSNYSNRWNTVKKLVPIAMKCVKRITPDLIQVFGTECEFGQIAKYTEIPVVIHMQGCVAPYLDAEYPPRYSLCDKILHDGFNIREQWHNWRSRQFNATWRELEKSNYEAVSYYMGRTEWDRKMIEIFHSDASYFPIWEALRPSFYNINERWTPKKTKRVHLITTGCSSHWKGMDMLLRTAHILKEKKLDFEWKVVGNMDSIKCWIEKKEQMKFEKNNVKILGFTEADRLTKLLLSADIYVHTAYIDNSPNSVCEAQYLGLPIIATRVGGIPSLVEDTKGGILVPANACYEMAYEIIKLCKDKDLQLRYSKWNKQIAKIRHNPKRILSDLLNCYNSIINSQITVTAHETKSISVIPTPVSPIQRE